jgi:hypothetical protein
MVITKHSIAEKIAAYLRHDISLAELVDWAERVLMEDEFDDQSIAVAPPIVARLGTADVRAFGLTWEDCETMLRTLGYDARVEVQAATPP